MTEENTESFEEFKANLEADNSTEPATEETKETTENNDSDTAVDNSDTAEVTETPEKNWKEEHGKTLKSYEELQSVFGRQGKELGDLRNFKKEMEPYLEYLQQVSQQQKQQQYANDPKAEYQDMLDKELQPFREQQVEYEASQTVSNLQEELGEETYDRLAPVMANVLRYYQDNDPTIAEYLAQNPVALVRQAAGDLFFNDMKTNQTQATSTQQTKQKQAQSMASTAKSHVAGKSTQGDMSTMNVEEMGEYLRKAGISQKIE